MPTINFAIRGEHIQLDQLLKATGLVSSGGIAHVEIAKGAVKVDGEVELRKRAKLRFGQHVAYEDTVIVLEATP
ncbi:MAG: RNA-binding S4 domain-containing protein [Gammaproteobacteria bacterium]|nr:RNA-binding S4 domain-containing protein [Gammaproteobacteria bacterium]